MAVYKPYCHKASYVVGLSKLPMLLIFLFLLILGLLFIHVVITLSWIFNSFPLLVRVIHLNWKKKLLYWFLCFLVHSGSFLWFQGLLISIAQTHFLVVLSFFTFFKLCSHFSHLNLAAFNTIICTFKFSLPDVGT